MPLSAGARFGAYEILSAIGAGGMGEVYRARDTKLDRDVAIKVLPSHLAADPEALARFEREAKAVAALSHPNILAIHDFGRERPPACRTPSWSCSRAAPCASGWRRTAAAEEGRPDRRGHRARPRRRACARHRASRPEARERVRHDRRPREDSRFRSRAAGRRWLATSRIRRPRSATPNPARSSARSATCRPSRSKASRPITDRICFRSAACCTNWRPAGGHSSARRRRKR